MSQISNNQNLKPAGAMGDSYSFGLIGYPLGHSLSPKIHGAALRALNMNGEYNLYPLEPSSSQRGIKQLLTQMRNGEIHGLNVTIPYKRVISPHLDGLTRAAEAIGAVNTVFRAGKRLIGENTDGDGFWADLQRLAGSGARRASNALILGAGGSARAVAYALLTNGFQVTIAARRIEQARELCDQFSVFSEQLSVSGFDQHPHSAIRHSPSATRHSSFIINCTPVGMTPDTAASPWPKDTPFPTEAVVYDLVYNPQETLLVRQARAAGLRAETGLGMLVDQAALAFERWTGKAPPRQAMREAAAEGE